MTIRVNLDRLPPEVVEALTQGDTVEFERAGEVAAVARPERSRGGRALWEALSRLERVDDDFEADIALLDEVVTPQESAWER